MRLFTLSVDADLVITGEVDPLRVVELAVLVALAALVDWVPDAEHLPVAVVGLLVDQTGGLRIL